MKTGLEQLIEILKDQSDVCEYIIAALFLNVSIKKIDEVISEVLTKLARKVTESLQLAEDKPRVMQVALCT